MIIKPFCSLLLERVKNGSLEHLLPVLLGILISVILIFYAKRALSYSAQWRFIHFVALAISGFVVIFHVYYIFKGNYNLVTDLPLYLCSLLAVIIPIFTYFRKFWMFEILLFWIIAGTLQGVITPDINEGFPSYDYFRYWVVHLGLLFIIFYIVLVIKWKPQFRSIFKSFFALQIYLALIFLINSLLGSNYFYLNEKPKSATVLDMLGEWPLYLLMGELILIPYFLVIYFPFTFKRKAK